MNQALVVEHVKKTKPGPHACPLVSPVTLWPDRCACPKTGTLWIVLLEALFSTQSLEYSKKKKKVN